MTVKELKAWLAGHDDNKEVIAKDKAHYEVEQILNVKFEDDKIVIVINE